MKELGIAVDTKQMLSIDDFIAEYDNKGNQIATPLNNPFLHRETEIEAINKHLTNQDILILSGVAGVGKTKIALQNMNLFLKQNADYQGFVIVDKGRNLFEDLATLLQRNKNYIILVDDANRQKLNLKSILSAYKEQKKGAIKLILTVRDYGLSQVKEECRELEIGEPMVIEAFSDEEIKLILESLGINNPIFHAKIQEIANGNVRLAVMAARIALKKQGEFLYNDAEDLYDAYFERFLKDNGIFQNKSLQKVMALCAFFYSFDRTDKAFIEPLLVSFGIGNNEFQEAIIMLQEKEILDVYDNRIKVSEQIMATYFFHKVFIKEKTLPFKTLLFEYLNQSYKRRFTDTIIPVNNLMGGKNVKESIHTDLNDFLDMYSEDEDKILLFYDIFWVFKIDEMFAYFYDKIDSMEEIVNPNYEIVTIKNNHYSKKDIPIDYLSKFFPHNTQYVIPAFELCMEYCRKKPDALTALFDDISKSIAFTYEVQNYQFYRQTQLIDLIGKNLDKPHYIVIFFPIAKHLLQHSFENHGWSRKRNSVSIQRYYLQLDEKSKALRAQLWTTLFKQYPTHSKEILELLANYSTHYIEKRSTEVYDFDIDFIVDFAKENLIKNDFEHIFLIRQLCSKFAQDKVSNRSYLELKSLFDSEEYQDFLHFDWNEYRGKQEHEFNDTDRYDEFKENELKKYFKITKKSDFKRFFNTVNLKPDWGTKRSVNCILEETMKNDAELGLSLLGESMKEINQYVEFASIFKSIFNISHDLTTNLWGIIEKYGTAYHQDMFLCFVPEKYITQEYYEVKIRLYQSEKGSSIFIGHDKKFQSFNPTFYQTILPIIVERNEKEKVHLPIWDNFFGEYIELFKDNFDIFLRAYLQQNSIQQHYDLGHENLRKIIEFRPKTLIDFIEYLFPTKEYVFSGRSNHKLGFIWDIDNIEPIVAEAIEYVVEKSSYFGNNPHPITIFFRNIESIDNLNKDRAINFLIEYIAQNYQNTSKIDAAFSVINTCFKSDFERVFLHYLSYNQDVKAFEQMHWINNDNGNAVRSAEVNFGKIEAVKWQRLLSLLPHQLSFIPIKKYINNRIEQAERYSKSEDLRRFSDNW